MSSRTACPNCGNDDLVYVWPAWVYQGLDGVMAGGEGRGRIWNLRTYSTNDIETMDDRQPYILCPGCGQTYPTTGDDRRPEAQELMDRMVRTYTQGGVIVETVIVPESHPQANERQNWSLRSTLSDGRSVTPIGGGGFRTIEDAGKALTRVEMGASGPVVT